MKGQSTGGQVGDRSADVLRRATPMLAVYCQARRSEGSEVEDRNAASRRRRHAITMQESYFTSEPLLYRKLFKGLDRVASFKCCEIWKR